MASFVKSLITRDILEWEAVLVAATSRPDVPRFLGDPHGEHQEPSYYRSRAKSDAVTRGAETPVDLYPHLV